MVRFEKRSLPFIALGFLFIFLFFGQFSGAFVVDIPAYIRNTGTTDPVYSGIIHEYFRTTSTCTEDDFGLDLLNKGMISAYTTENPYNLTVRVDQCVGDNNDSSNDLLREAACGTNIDVSRDGNRWKHLSNIMLTFDTHCKDVLGPEWICREGSGRCIKSENFITTPFPSVSGNTDMQEDPSGKILVVSNRNGKLGLYDLTQDPPSLIREITNLPLYYLQGVAIAHNKVYTVSGPPPDKSTNAFVQVLGKRSYHAELYFDNRPGGGRYGDIVYSQIHDRVYAVHQTSDHLMIINPNDDSFTFFTLGPYAGNPPVRLALSPSENVLYIVDRGTYDSNSVHYLYGYSLPDLQLLPGYLQLFRSELPPELAISPATGEIFASQMNVDAGRPYLLRANSDFSNSNYRSLDVGETGLAINLAGSYLITGTHVRNVYTNDFKILYTIPQPNIDANHLFFSSNNKAFLTNENDTSMYQVSGFTS